jgi:hypothetical protein
MLRPILNLALNAALTGTFMVVQYLKDIEYQLVLPDILRDLD